MANAANTRNVRNSKSRQYAQDRNKFGGSSAADTSGQPKSYSSESASKTKPTSQYGLKEASPRGSGITAKGVTSSAVKGLGRLASGLGGASMLLEPGNLSGDETPYKGSKDSYTATSAKDRAADLLNQPRSKVSADEVTESIPASKKDAPSVTVKKEIIKSTPADAVAAVKKSDSKSMAAPVKKSSPRETSKGSRNSMADDWNAFSKGREADTAALKDITDRYGKTGTLVERSADDTAELAALKPEDFKKGGMTRRPPARPTKKVPARKFASGGTTRSSTSHRGDGCATKGHTKGRVR